MLYNLKMISIFAITYFPPLILLIALAFLYLIQKFTERGLILRIISGFLMVLLSFYTGCFISQMLSCPYGAVATGIFLGKIISFIAILIKGTGILFDYFKLQNSLNYYFKKEKILTSLNNYVSIKKLAENYLIMGEYDKAKKVLEDLLKNTEEGLIKEKINMEIDNLEAFLKSMQAEDKKICRFCKNEIPDNSLICNFCRKNQYPVLPLDFFIRKFKIPLWVFLVFPVFFLLFLFTLNLNIAFSWLFVWFTLAFLVYDPFESLKIPSKEKFD